MILADVRRELVRHYPDVLVDALLESYEKTKQNYYLLKHEPSELNGGKFVESVVRILQFVTQGEVYTPIGTHIPDMPRTLRGFESVDAAVCDESFRIHLPRALLCIYNVRNKRGVGHLGGDVNPNLADSTLIAGVCDWVVAELVRLNFGCTLDEAQGLVDGVVQRKLPTVAAFGGTKRVLNPKLSLRDKTLIHLAEEYPASVAVHTLIEWIEPSNSTYYRDRVLRPLHQERLIEYSTQTKNCIISPTGLKIVETMLPKWIL